jgi:hypothetical protein
MTPIYITLAVIFFALAIVCEYVERKWYRDRNLLRASGACVAMSAMMVACGIAL